jgi:hypothetical protein
MPAFRIKRQLLATGGATISGGTTISGSLLHTNGPFTAGSITNTSGSMTINASGVAIGAGTKVTKMLFGTGIVFAPSFGAAAAASGGGVESSCGMTLTGAAIGNYVWATATSMPTGLTMVSASPYTDGLEMGFIGAACTAVAACHLTIQYLVLSA